MKPSLLIPASLLALGVLGCLAQEGGAPPAVGTPVRELQERIAREFENASPLADPADARARDIAANKLTGCQTFLAAAGKKMLWGGCEPVKGYDPSTYSLTEFDPLVWLKLYASTMMFTGEHEVKNNGDFSVLEMKAKFRAKLDAGDYPYPFWHSAKKWQAYVDLASLCVVFRGEKLCAVYRVANPNPAQPPAERKWDGKWQWTDTAGNPQPRVALFTYMFGTDNPHRAGTEEAYRKLEARFRAQECTSCHAPDNAGKAKALLLLNFPNQSLISRHNLVQVLKDNEMPPADREHNKPAGIPDDTGRKELIQLAETFAKAADQAVAFERSRNASAQK